MGQRSRSILLLLCLIGMSWSGLASATVVQVQVRNSVPLLTRLYGDRLQDALLKELVTVLRSDPDLKHWDFSADQSSYQLVVHLDQGIPGTPPAILLFFDIFDGQQRLASSARIPWREVNDQKPFGTAAETAAEVMSFLGQLFSQGSQALRSALQRQVPIGTGGQVRTLKSVVLALTEQRHRDLRRSDFRLLCPLQRHAHLYCMGADNFISWNSSSSLEAIPLCFEDDRMGRHAISSKPEISKQVLDLKPEEIYLYNFVGKNDFSVFRLGNCP